MAGASEITLVGVSHARTPLAQRERCAVAAAALSARCRELREETGARECCVISTCNRTEILLAGAPAGAGGRLQRLAFEGIDGVHEYTGLEALFHLYRVAAGLESQVLGETQILAQLREAATAARAAGTLGESLGAAIEGADKAGRRVRAETAIGEGTLSVARAAIQLALKVTGALSGRQAMVIGCGATGRLAARCLEEVGARNILCANRTRSSAEELAEEMGGSAHTLEELPDLLARADVALVAVEAPEPVVQAAHFVNFQRRQHPLVLLDISVPRGVDPALRQQRDLFLADMDDLESIVRGHRRGRRKAAEDAALILVAEVGKFEQRQALAVLKPRVVALVRRFEEIRAEALRAEAGRGDATRFSELLTQRLLDEALQALRGGLREEGAGEDLLARYKSHIGES